MAAQTTPKPVPVRTGKKQGARPLRLPKPRAALDVEDDDWTPLATTMTPTRVISEFIENDYDMM